ncbi:hypothetical protein GF336_04935 [Candidatus Woesearchaeota archaeon]|nr:hypothetical protein [Candidatus Woesearchaeota archaeon]
MKSPFFIIGCGRSGTTLLRSMLNSHKDVAIPLESLFIIDYLKTKKTINVLKKLIVDEYEIKEWGIDITYNDVKDVNDKKELISRIHNIYTSKNNKRIWGQKTPRFVRYGKLLKRHYPDSKFIHIIRDPRAVVSSLIESNVHKSNVLYGSRRWVNDVRKGIVLKERHPEDVLEIKYEHLVSNPKKELEKICKFLEIKFDENMLKYYKSKKEYREYYSRIHSKLSKPVDKKSISKWELKLDKKQVMLIENICGELMEKLGYKRRYKRKKTGLLYVLLLKIERKLKLFSQFKHYFLKRKEYIYSFLKRKIKLGFFKDLFNLSY